MADVSYPGESVQVISRPNWGAIWAGMFTFLAIWGVFETLGLGIFASPANATQPATGVNVGIGIWTIILTIIAMFVGGRVTGQLAGIVNTRDGMMHGMVMFGLSVAAALVLVVIGGGAAAGAQAPGTVHNAYLFTILSGMEWAFFAALFLGWLAAMGGASSAHKRLVQPGIQREVVHHTS